MNTLASQGIPFLFIADYKGDNVKVIPLDKLQHADVEFCIDEHYTYKPHNHTLVSTPVPYAKYQQMFDAVINKIESGETYILNLTQPTPVQTSLSLQEIYQIANARYKLRVGDEFTCFSPETFVQIVDGKIITYPMKGTIDATVPHAHKRIIEDEKEKAEHVMIVDLLRNDLSMVADNVTVESFRDVQTIKAGEKELLQVTSKISATLPKDWKNYLGYIIQTLLPAGSISGTPKMSTVDIIEDIEGYDREYYTGVFGVFDGEQLDSGVMIRFIQKGVDGLIYKSGGGITIDSICQREYDELIQKIYLP